MLRLGEFGQSVDIWIIFIDSCMILPKSFSGDGPFILVYRSESKGMKEVESRPVS